MSYKRKQELLCAGIVVFLLTFAVLASSCSSVKPVYKRADYVKCDCILDSDD